MRLFLTFEMEKHRKIRLSIDPHVGKNIKNLNLAKGIVLKIIKKSSRDAGNRIYFWGIHKKLGLLTQFEFSVSRIKGVMKKNLPFVIGFEELQN